ncbi:VOC family protein [Flagellimonas nanhaiensis]|uniref:VOC family protein n=1 Tax=Flagellimonas nanhaiensis TaxID=2292706 RepID=A0A371JQH8_9FLAO|nr:VOC family protein [Allomuricauda nanhaiensis]RDY59768.1 VOC family protein [Allomuricauda nanhaiensis]
MKINEIVAAIPVLDVNRAKEFYVKTLGFQLEVLSETMGMYWAKINNGRFLLYKRNDENKAEHTAISFTVESIEEAVGELESKGVKFFEAKGEKIFNLDGSLSAWFQDPEGNNLEISERP